MMMVLAAGLLAASPVLAHCGKCGMEEAHEGTEMKQCKPDCDKPCCAHKDGDKKQCAVENCDKPCCADKKDKVCSTHGKKDCCDKKGHGHAKQNFGPRSRK